MVLKKSSRHQLLSKDPIRRKKRTSCIFGHGLTDFFSPPATSIGSNLWSCKFLLATKGSNPSSVLPIVPSVRFTLVSVMPAAGWKKMTEEEVRLANAWYTEDGLPPSAIAERLGRDKSVLTRCWSSRCPRRSKADLRPFRKPR